MLIVNAMLMLLKRLKKLKNLKSKTKNLKLFQVKNLISSKKN